MNAIKNFVKDWSNRGYEKGEKDKFWLQFLRDVSKVDKPETYIDFEVQVPDGAHTKFIDAYIPDTRVIIEQKSITEPLDDAVFQQAKNYDNALNISRKARWIITCNFKEFRIYDMDKSRPAAEPVRILLSDLPDNFHVFDFLIKKRRNLEAEKKLTFETGDAIKRFYGTMKKQFVAPNAKETLDNLTKLCVRLVFCLYSDSAGIFSEYKIFSDYLASHSDIRRALLDIFKVLDTPYAERSPYDELRNFPYVDGGLFKDEKFDFPSLKSKAREILFNELCIFRWRDINPTIFGAVFESVLDLNDDTDIRRGEGIHYTAPENIQKVVNPLFMEDFYNKFANAKSRDDLFALQAELASLKIFDPACGSGNFLTESYILIRELENAIIDVLKHDGVKFKTLDDAIRVSINQFYGIEINAFAVAVAKTALWISEIQMRLATAEILELAPSHFPLRHNPNIMEANALRTDWFNLISPSACSFIVSNPPFIGTKGQSAAQKADLASISPVFKPLDYVSGWYKKTSDFVHSTNIRAAFVSTNSICQGEQVAALWYNLDVHIDFAFKTFKWFSESKDNAQVHVIVIGFSHAPNPKPKRIFTVEFAKDADGKRIEIITATTAQNINGYLIDAPNVYVENRHKPICDAPKMTRGSGPTDDGNLIIEAEDYDAFVKAEPRAVKYIRPYVGAEEFINNKKRWCLWLVDCPPSELRKMKHVLKRVEAVKKFRLKSPSASTRRDAETPSLFQSNRQPSTNYLAIPRVSSENRRYVPIGFMTPDIIISDAVQIIPDATIYHFGVLTSSVHMAWMRVVCGRLRSDYRYSATIVYNNFPWQEVTARQRAAIEATAGKILAVRAKYTGESLADLYNETTMPPDLRAAHRANDLAVLKAYGFSAKMTEEEIFRALMERYVALTR